VSGQKAYEGDTRGVKLGGSIFVVNLISIINVFMRFIGRHTHQIFSKTAPGGESVATLYLVPRGSTGSAQRPTGEKDTRRDSEPVEAFSSLTARKMVPRALSGQGCVARACDEPAALEPRRRPHILCNRARLALCFQHSKGSIMTIVRYYEPWALLERFQQQFDRAVGESADSAIPRASAGSRMSTSVRKRALPSGR